MLVTHFPTFVPDISSSILDRRSRLLLVDTVVNSTAEISDEDLLSDEEQGLPIVPHRLDQRAIYGDLEWDEELGTHSSSTETVQGFFITPSTFAATHVSPLTDPSSLSDERTPLLRKATSLKCISPRQTPTNGARESPRQKADEHPFSTFRPPNNPSEPCIPHSTSADRVKSGTEPKYPIVGTSTFRQTVSLSSISL